MPNSRTPLPRRISIRISRFEEAVRAHAFRGARAPEEHYELDRNLIDSVRELRRVIREELDKAAEWHYKWGEKQEVPK